MTSQDKIIGNSPEFKALLRSLQVAAATDVTVMRFLESAEIQSGDSDRQQPDVRIVTATHCDLEAKVKNGEFREDLYYRLNVVPFHVPPLRERTEDIPLLINEFSSVLHNIHKIAPATFSKECMAELNRYSWPGNVRELRNFCERMLILFSGRQVEIDNLPTEIRNQSRKQENLFTLPDKGIKWEELEQDLIIQALQKTRGNQSKAARLLGLTRDTFLYRIRKYAIQL